MRKLGLAVMVSGVLLLGNYLWPGIVEGTTLLLRAGEGEVAMSEHRFDVIEDDSRPDWMAVSGFILIFVGMALFSPPRIWRRWRRYLRFRF